MNIFVRADFYPSGTVIPLSITINDGTTYYINKIISIKKEYCKHGIKSLNFICKTEIGEIYLKFEDHKWSMLE